MRLLLLSLLAVLTILTAPTEAGAQISRAEQIGRALEGELSLEEKKAIQEALVWTGNYDGKIDGLFGRGTRSAIAAFQERRGYRPTGYLRQRHVDRLFAEREAITARFGWEIRRFPDLGMELGIPGRLFGEPEPTEIGVRFRSRQGARPRAELLLYSAPPMGERRFEQLREEVVDRQRFARDIYDRAGRGWFVFSGRSAEGIAQYTYVVDADEGVRGFSFRYDDDDRGYDVLNTAMYNSLKAFRATGDPVARAPEPPVRDDQDRKQAREDGQGTIISREGIVLTTADVVAECRDIRVNGRFGATVAAIDRQLGLAALKLDAREEGYPHLGLRVAPLEARTDVDVFVTRQDDGRADTDAFPARLAERGDDPLRFGITSERLGQGSAGAAVIDIDGRVAGVVEAGRGPRDGGRRRDRVALTPYAAMAFLSFHGLGFGTEASDQNTRRVVRRATVGIACED